MNVYPRFMLVGLVGAASLACGDENPTVPDASRFHDLVTVEITFDNIGKPIMTASGVVHGNSAISFDALSVGFLDHRLAAGGGTRYCHALFRVRNAFRQVNGTIPSNVTLVGVGTALTFPGTPISMLTTEGGVAAATTFAQQVRATARASFTEDGVVVVDSANVMRVFAAAEMVPPAMHGITSVFNFGYVVRHAGPVAANDGIATVAFALPLLDVRTQNASALSVMLLVRLELP